MLRTLKEKIAYNSSIQTAVFSGGLFVAFAVLVYLFPYTGDDWYWGSQAGLDRLADWFADYNGRYAGNLLVLALTRSKLISSVVMGASLVGVCFLPKLFATAKGFAAYAFSTLLFLLLPREIFAQAVAWTSGFSNYVPPILLTMLYFVAVKNIFDENPPKYNSLMCVPVAVTGFISALFMENVTVFNIGASLLIIGYTYMRFKRVYAVHLAHLVGSVAGAVLMFSNSAYGLIAQKQDFYRTTVFERGFVATLTENLKEVAERFFAENIVTVSVFSLLLVALYITFASSGAEGARKRLGIAMLNVNLTCLVPFYCKGKLYDWDLFFESEAYAVITATVLSAIVALYFISAVTVVLICVDCRKTRSKTVFLLLCIPMLVAPLLFVSPIGPRCFFPPYLMLMGVCVLIFTYLQKKLRPDAALVKRTGVLLVTVCGIIMSFLFGIYGVVHWYDARRNEFAKKQADAGFNTVMMYYLPYTYYVWNGDPDIEPWEGNYKEFHDIDEDVKLKFILRENFNEFEKNFEE